MTCYHIELLADSKAHASEISYTLRQHLSLSGLAGFRHAGSGWSDDACLTAVLVDKKKDLDAALKAWDAPESCSFKLVKGEPLKDLDAEDEAFAALVKANEPEPEDADDDAAVEALSTEE